MLSRQGVVGGLTLAVTLILGPPCWATIDSLKSFKAAYPGKDAKAYSCKVCHQGVVGKKGDLNAYGQALQKLKAPATAKALTVEDYRAVEKDDADGDGASNLQEWEAGAKWADPASVPERQGGDTPSSLAPQARDRVLAYLDRLATPPAWADKDASADPAATEAPNAEYVGMETCASCHAAQHKEFLQSTHARIAIPGDMKAQGCEMCHGPGSLHVAAGGGRGVGDIINPRKDPGTCFACHLDKPAEFRLPHHHPVMEGKMSCADCHEAHGPEIRPWSATTLNDVNEACFRCHKEQRGPFAWEHEALREGCATCHKVHGSIHEKMLLARDNNLCLRCHTQANFPTIGKSNHAGRLPQGTCFSAGCHTAVHGSNFDDHLRY